jgi:hypothetical protein
MEICIDGNAIDISLDTEHTVGDVLAGVGQWLDGSGFRLSGLEIDGALLGSGALDGVFDRELTDIERLNILTESIQVLRYNACIDALLTVKEWESTDNEGKERIACEWERSPEMTFLATEDRILFTEIQALFNGGAYDGSPRTSSTILNMIEDRLREQEDPFSMINAFEDEVLEAARRMEDLALDLQTGKDRHAGQTVMLFSAVSEKIMRLLPLLPNARPVAVCAEEDSAAFESPHLLWKEFRPVLEEFLAAYETQDSVLAGDLAEYEVAPRLRALYESLQQAGAAVGMRRLG